MDRQARQGGGLHRALGLERVEERELETTLVGFSLPNAGEVPSEGRAVVADGAPAGRVTSSRYSPSSTA